MGPDGKRVDMSAFVVPGNLAPTQHMHSEGPAVPLVLHLPLRDADGMPACRGCG